jgi:hypothetical protein
LALQWSETSYPLSALSSRFAGQVQNLVLQLGAIFTLQIGYRVAILRAKWI